MAKISSPMVLRGTQRSRYCGLYEQKEERIQGREEKLSEFSDKKKENGEANEAERGKMTREEGSDEELSEKHVEIGENVEKTDLGGRAVELVLKKNDLMG